MTTATRIVELADGIRATLVHQPQATRAAALVKVGAGSHHETDALPGLAHLLEHLLFRGSQRYHADERLMAWIQRQGGSVNAAQRCAHLIVYVRHGQAHLALLKALAHADDRGYPLI